MSLSAAFALPMGRPSWWSPMIIYRYLGNPENARYASSRLLQQFAPGKLRRRFATITMADEGAKSPPPGEAKTRLHGRAFYESIGSPKYIVAPMVDQSEFVRPLQPSKFQVFLSSIALEARRQLTLAPLSSSRPGACSHDHFYRNPSRRNC